MPESAVIAKPSFTVVFHIGFDYQRLITQEVLYVVGMLKGEDCNIDAKPLDPF